MRNFLKLSARREGNQGGPGCTRGRNTNCQSGCRQRSHAWRKGWIQAHRNGVHACGRLTGVAELIIDLDELDPRELFEGCNQRASNVVQRTIRLTAPCKVHIGHAISELHFSIAGKTIIDHGKTLVPLHVTWTLEELVEDRLQDIL